jgi:hypothetical protein
MELVVVALAVGVLGLVVLAGRLWLQLRAVRERFRPVLDLDSELARTRQRIEQSLREFAQTREQHHAALDTDLAETRKRIEQSSREFAQTSEQRHAVLDRELAETRQRIEQGAREIDQVREKYQTAKALYDRLMAEIALVEENVEDISVGLYKPHFDYDTTEAYRNKLAEICERQKRMVREDKAVSYGIAWTVGNSRKEGEKMQKQYAKLLLRAFNGESDAAIAKVSWDNVLRMEERMRKAFEAISKLGGVMQISLHQGYCELKLDELRLEHELENRRRLEAEEQRRIREQMREEEKAQRELERAQREAEEEEARQVRALEKARKELAKASGAKLDALTARIAELEGALSDAHAMKERAKSMAELTKRGYVYVISNHGSFGADVLKIGMTRRLDPMDRVRELGDASVPFEFDVHAMIYSDDAPALENALHREFSKGRMNLVNLRKEFFRVSLSDLKMYAEKAHLPFELTLIAEAREYRETLARLAENDTTAIATARRSRFPEAI